MSVLKIDEILNNIVNEVPKSELTEKISREDDEYETVRFNKNTASNPITGGKIIVKKHNL